MKKRKVWIILPLLLLCGCSAAKQTVEPSFDFTATCTAGESFSGQLTFLSDGISKITAATPEDLSGMTAEESNAIVTVKFSGIEKSSERYPGIKELSVSKILLALRDVSKASLNYLSQYEDGTRVYSAQGNLGEYQLGVSPQGTICYLTNTAADFSIKLSDVTKLNVNSSPSEN